MNERDLKSIRKALQVMRERIGAGLSAIEKDTLNQSQRDASGDLSGYSFHMADVATDNYDREFSLDRASNEQQALNAIDDALKKIEEGIYGLCEECGKKITIQRLKAVPYAAKCIQCKTKEEENKGRR